MVNKENLILLGAGASYKHIHSPHLYSNSQYINPPLGNELAAKLRKSSPQWVLLEAKYGPCGPDFEEWSKNLIGDDESNKTDGQHDYVRYLLVLTSFFYKFNKVYNSSKYISLLQILKPCMGSTSFVSLNYEILFELALRKLGYRVIPSDKDYEDLFNKDASESEDSVAVYKPHGSVNFRLKIAMEGYFKRCPIDFSASANISSVTTQIVDTIDENQKVCPSIISAYVPSKLTSLNSHFIEQIRSQLLRAIQHHKKVVIIGIKANAKDEFMYHYFKNIFSTVSDVLLFCGDDAYKEYKKLFPGVNFQFDDKDPLLYSPSSYQRISKYLSAP